MVRNTIAVSILTASLSFVPPASAAGSTEGMIIDRDGKESGTIALSSLAAGGVQIVATAEGLPPGVHAFHLHETGQCDPAEGFKTAGGHHNPTNADHGWESPEGPHAGDLPNVHIQDDGFLAIQHFVTTVSLDENDPATLFDDDGSALVIHQGPDDYMTDPAGAAGDRIACAVIEPR